LDLLPEDIIQKIAAYKVTQGDDNEDHFVWDGTSHGGFSMKLVVNIIRKNIQEEMHPVWQLIVSLASSKSAILPLVSTT